MKRKFAYKFIASFILTAVIVVLTFFYLRAEEQKGHWTLFGFYIFISPSVGVAGLISFLITRKRIAWRATVLYITVTFLSLAFIHGIFYIPWEYLPIMAFTWLPSGMGLVMLTDLLRRRRAFAESFANVNFDLGIEKKSE
jgi:hypothetical protein